MSGFGPQKCVECGGLSGEEGERRGDFVGHSETRVEGGELRGFVLEKQKREERKNVSESKW